MKSRTGLKIAFAKGPTTGTLEMTGNPALIAPSRVRLVTSILPLGLCCELLPFRLKSRLSPAHGRATLADEIWLTLECPKLCRDEKAGALVAVLGQHTAAVPITLATQSSRKSVSRGKEGEKHETQESWWLPRVTNTIACEKPAIKIWRWASFPTQNAALYPQAA